jgi:apolipoprotein N-acyltransferase
MRAMETGRYLLRATNTGMTAIVSPHGEIIKQAPLFTTTVLTESITPMGGLTPFSRFGDKPVITLMFILLLCAMLYGKFFKLKVFT